MTPTRFEPEPLDARALWAAITIAEKRELAALLRSPAAFWQPLPGPQEMAFHHTADVIGYGGAAGGGKTDLLLAKALLRHRVAVIMRRESTQLTGVIDRAIQLIGNDDGLSRSHPAVWRNAGPKKALLYFASAKNENDVAKQQGNAKDFLGLDEATGFSESQVRFLLGWVRSTRASQKTQAVLCFNPPTTAEGRWIVSYFAPWLDDKYTGKRALPGETRFFATLGDKQIECPNADEFEEKGIKIKPKSRTFIASKVQDNPFLLRSGYASTLAELPEPLRSQMLYGDFTAGTQDDAFQVIPTAWIDAAMARWRKDGPLPPMDSLGVDVARGGKDKSELARRHGWFFDTPLSYPGAETPDGAALAALVIAAMGTHDPTVQIELNGVGVSPYDILKKRVRTVPVDVTLSTEKQDRSGLLGMSNLRSWLWWHGREMLDPDRGKNASLPPDAQLKRELASAKYRVVSGRVVVSDRDTIIKSIGTSPDRATAYLLAALETPHKQLEQARATASGDPFNYKPGRF